MNLILPFYLKRGLRNLMLKSRHDFGLWFDLLYFSDTSHCYSFDDSHYFLDQMNFWYTLNVIKESASFLKRCYKFRMIKLGFSLLFSSLCVNYEQFEACPIMLKNQ